MALQVSLVTPDREVWEGPAAEVVARGTEGEVGILSGHAPMLIRLAIGVLRIKTEEGAWRSAVVDGGFLHVTSAEGTTRVDVLATHAEMADQIDRRAAEARVEEMKARLAKTEDVGARAELAKALARLDAAD
ncbi:MAG TPA: ATP synthase F1 subunit epsilon, partial [Actinomycetota bacterium]|nr:ATP synthase F1 subunit epsilon [Actinomycetota bacterium]